MRLASYDQALRIVERRARTRVSSFADFWLSKLFQFNLT